MILSDATRYVRSVDPAAFDPETWSTQVMYVGECCRIAVTAIPAGAAGPARHTHAVDQFLFVLAGEAQVELGAETVPAPVDTGIFVPAGTPHRVLGGAAAVRVLEVLAPGPDPNALPWTDTDATDGPGTPIVRALADQEIDPKITFIDRRFLVQRDDHSAHLMIYEAKIHPGQGHPDVHIHDVYDQFYWVLDGALSVEIAGVRETARAGTLVVLASGVPHRLWNEAEETSQHLSLILPSPPQGQGGDIPVEFAIK